MKFSSSFTVVMKTTSLQLPSLAGTSIKSMLQSAPKHVIFILNKKKISTSDPSPSGRGTPSRFTPSAPTHPSAIFAPSALTHARTPSLGSLVTAGAVGLSVCLYVCRQNAKKNAIFDGTCSVVVSAQRRHRRATISDVGRRLSDRYADAVPCTQWYARTHNWNWKFTGFVLGRVGLTSEAPVAVGLSVLTSGASRQAERRHSHRLQSVLPVYRSRYPQGPSYTDPTW